MMDRQDYINAGRAARKSEKVVEVVDELTDTVYAFFRSYTFLPTTDNFEQLLRLPAKVFAEYVPDPDRQYEQYKVIKLDSWKLYFQNNGKIQEQIRIEDNRIKPSILKIFRSVDDHDPDGTPRNWIGEEFCIQDMRRFWQDGDPNRTGWYRVKSARVDSATPPPNDGQNWVKDV